SAPRAPASSAMCRAIGSPRPLLGSLSSRQESIPPLSPPKYARQLAGLQSNILDLAPQRMRASRRPDMYRYDEFDREFVRQRAAQFRDQVGRRLSGELTEDEFKPLRLMNGVYLQLHAYMLRIAIPYGTLNSRQMRKLAHIARTYDRGTGHFTTRQNLQFNWPKLSDIPDILKELAEVEMHAIQTSGNCIRNVTADHFAGATAEEVADPRPYAEII